MMRPLTQENSRNLDLALLAAIASGDAGDAFETLYRRHVRAVARAVERRCGDAHLADEATNDAFLRLWTRAADMIPEAMRVRPWLVTVAMHAATDRLRRKQHATTSIDHAYGLASPETAPHERVERRETAREMSAALARLPGSQREALVLSYYAGLSQSEVAERLGEPLGTIKSRCRLGLGRLRESLGTRRGLLEIA